MVTGAVLLLLLTSGVAVAQGRGSGRQGQADRTQVRGAQRGGQAKFADQDRERARNWYAHARRGGGNQPPGLSGRELPPGLRDRDRLPPGLAERIRPGYVIEVQVRVQIFPAPPELVRVLAPPPPGHRYVAFGGNILMLNASFRIADVIELGVSLVR